MWIPILQDTCHWSCRNLWDRNMPRPEWYWRAWHCKASFQHYRKRLHSEASRSTLLRSSQKYTTELYYKQDTKTLFLIASLGFASKCSLRGLLKVMSMRWIFEWERLLSLYSSSLHLHISTKMVSGRWCCYRKARILPPCQSTGPIDRIHRAVCYAKFWNVHIANTPSGSPSNSLAQGSNNESTCSSYMPKRLVCWG